MADDLVKALSDLKEEEALKIVEALLESGEEPLKILEDCRKAMEVVGKRFEKGEYFVPDLIYAGEILKEISEIIKPKMKKEAEIEKLGKVIIGTVAGDVHDIGKNIVTFMLDVSGFEVYDLGVDVPPEKFVEKIKETGARVVGMSGLLTLAYDSMKKTVEAIEAAGLRDQVKIMIGGSQVDDEVRKYAGADAYGADALAAVKFAKEWTGGEE